MAVKVASDEYLKLKEKVSKLASMANKRLVRLEKNELTNLPAYQTWQRNGAIRFSVKGKNYQQLQSEFWRLKNFLDDKTSTVRQANKFLKEMAKNTGIKYHGLKDLKEKSKKFFELADKIKQYYKSVERNAEALNYQRIWTQINEQVKIGTIELDSVESTESMLDKYLAAMEEVQPVEEGQEGYLEISGKNWDFIKLK